MNWPAIYERLIESRQQRVLPVGSYSEEHHIKPRWCGGSDQPDNLVRLTAREHYVAHLLLAKAYGGRHWGAVWVLANARPERFIGTARVPPSRSVATWLELIRKAHPEAAAKAVDTKRAAGTLAIAGRRAAETKAATGQDKLAAKKAAETKAATGKDKLAARKAADTLVQRRWSGRPN